MNTVVASRDEVCSLVAFERAMMIKPFIVSEGVDVKYMVNRGNGYIAKTCAILEVKEILMKMIDNQHFLEKIGIKLHKNY